MSIFSPETHAVFDTIAQGLELFGLVALILYGIRGFICSVKHGWKEGATPCK